MRAPKAISGVSTPGWQRLSDPNRGPAYVTIQDVVLSFMDPSVSALTV